MKVVWQRKAVRDLDDIWDYSVAMWGDSRARAYLTAIRATADALASADRMGSAEDGVKSGLRRQFSGSHAVWYRMDGEPVQVIRVLQQSQEAGRWMD